MKRTTYYRCDCGGCLALFARRAGKWKQIVGMDGDRVSLRYEFAPATPLRRIHRLRALGRIHKAVSRTGYRDRARTELVIGCRNCGESFRGEVPDAVRLYDGCPNCGSKKVYHEDENNGD